ncbi:EF-hand calcium-binding domain-containing protein 8 isoform X9 [Canis lupus baileyi]|uniref:EF-hand calcium-binding domain-containing protein 8 isoform X9 n=1 Tax=Canis lupus familiaris TaxID=9615 RepID=UPI0006B3D1FF|nr:EF-hand calcium-binding domain-containing protein 8 isoform X9 [Canis lupus familiaris]XP_038427920.1 EF-hand calcium-binding domain-containing protein 8 isoform X9 [Canis lupus familiaris]|eukprot:XP_013962702.1 EF-hand calcium-binding domain-containing protein 8 isoform X9 [Canis lupus familiaris]
MSQLRWKSKTNIFLSKIASKVTWEEQLGSGSKPSSSEDLRESPQSQEASTPGGFQKNEEVLSSPASTVTLSHHESQLFTQLHMVKMEKMFEDDVDSTGALDMKTFIKAIKKILSNASDEMLEALFLKVDTDCNGSITWQEYVDYVMRELQRRERMRTSQYRLHFHLPMRIIPLNHGCEIVKVQFLTQRFKKMGHLLTVTKDGILQIWSESFSLLNSFRLNQIHQPYNQQMWVTDMVCLHNMNLIAIASTDQKIEFFDITNHNCARAFTFIDLDSCVLTMDYWSDYHRGVFCYGDTKGNVIVFTSDNVTHGLFNPRILPRTSKWDHWTKVSTRKLLNEKSPLYRSYWLKALHPNWCQQVKFIPQLNTVASCSAIEKSSLVLIALPSKAPESPKFSVLNLRKGILCFDYCPDKNLVVTGGYDPLIRLWNPFFSKKPVWMMKGHQTSVTHILVNSKNSSILLSISKDKNIRVWDMQDYICLQSFSGKLFALGNCPITSVYFHKNEDSLICSTFSIGILKGYLETEGPGKPRERTTTYSTPLCAVLYSKIFKQVVSGCLSSLVSVWEIKTGKRMMEFSVTGDQQVELTTMCLDESERCLLTGLRDGTIKMWNYTVGECLLTFPNPDQLEISGIVHMNKVFYVTGWSKRITCFMLHKTKPVLLCYQWQSFHKEDVLSMAKYQNQFLGTSSYNGDILFWNINLFKPILNFNASKSPWPLLPKKIQEVDNSLAESLQSSKLCVKHKEWAYKPSTQPLGPRARAVANANLQRNLMSAPPVMKRPRDKEPEKPMPPQVGAEVRQKHVSSQSPKLLRMPHGKQSIIRDAQRKRGEFQKKILLQSNTSVEKVMAGQTISLVPPKLLNAWKGHLDSVADILYVDSFQLIISAGHDCDVKAWKLSGDTIGTFGVSVWKGLQDIQTVGDLALRKSSEEEADSIDAAQKAFRPELQEERALAEALVYQRREQVALMALLNGKADAEAEAWGKLQRITQMSPWAGEHYSEDVEHSWLEWESKGKQVSKIVGGAYKAKDRSRSPGVLSTNVQYGWMKHQISPQIYQSLHFNQLSPTHTPDFLVHNILGHHGQHIYLVTHNSQKDLDPEETNSSTASVSPSDTLTPKASGSGFLESALSTSPYLQPSLSLLSQPSRYVTQRSAPPMPVASSIKLLSRPLKAALSSSMKKSHGVRF